MPKEKFNDKEFAKILKEEIIKKILAKQGADK